MDTKKILIGLVIALALLNLSTILTIVYHVYSEKKEQEKIVIETNSIRLDGRYFVEQLGLTSDQAVPFREAIQTFHQSAREINQQLNVNRNQLFTELRNEETDTIICQQLSAEIGILHKNLKEETYRFYLEIKRISTPDQQLKLKEIFAPVFESDNGIVPGKGNRQNRMKQLRNNQ